MENKINKIVFGPCSKVHNYIYAIVRIIIGLLIANAGLGKFISGAAFNGFMGLPGWLAFIVASSELIAGILITIGLFTYYATGVALIIMFVAVGFHIKFDGIGAIVGSGNKALVYGLLFAAIHAKGTGIWSLDKKLFSKRKK